MFCRNNGGDRDHDEQGDDRRSRTSQEELDESQNTEFGGDDRPPLPSPSEPPAVAIPMCWEPIRLRSRDPPVWSGNRGLAGSQDTSVQRGETPSQGDLHK